MIIEQLRSLRALALIGTVQAFASRRPDQVTGGSTRAIRFCPELNQRKT
jgi:hypothetical protein